jgi:hypothetical protein
MLSRPWKIFLIIVATIIALIIIIIPSVICGMPITQPVITQPVITQPVITQPVITQPATTQPATTQPATTQPATTQPATLPPIQIGSIELYTSATPGLVYQMGDPYVGALGARNETTTFCTRNMPNTCISKPVGYLYYDNDSPNDFIINYKLSPTVPVIGPNGKSISTNWDYFVNSNNTGRYLENNGSQTIFRTGNNVNNCLNWEANDAQDYSYSGTDFSNQELTNCSTYIPYVCACNSSKTPE